MKYAAFLSYRRDPDARLAAALQSGLHRLGRPWYRMYALRVFMDRTDLTVNPGLWSSIQSGLEASGHFLLIASSEAAKSPWVRREVDHWLAHRTTMTVLVLLSEGDLVWDNESRDFDWSRTDALPATLQGKFAEEPAFLDLRWTRSADGLSLRDPRFKEAVAEVAAFLKGCDKSAIIGEDLRQYRRTRRISWSAVAVLIGLLLIAVQQRNTAVRAADAERAATQRAVAAAGAERDARVAATTALANETAAKAEAERRRIEAENQRRLADEQRALAEQRRELAVARQLSAESQSVLNDSNLVDRGFALALESARRGPSRESGEVLFQTGRLLRSVTARISTEDTARHVAFSPDGKSFAGLIRSGIFVWDLAARRLSFEIRKRDLVHFAFSPKGDLFAAASADRRLSIWDVRVSREVKVLQQKSGVGPLAFSDDGRYLASRDGNGLALWDTRSWQETTIPIGDEVRVVAFDPGAEHVVSVTRTGSVHSWSVANKTFTGHVNVNLSEDAVALHRSGQVVAVMVERGTIRVYETATLTELTRFVDRGEVTRVQVVGPFVATNGTEPGIRLWGWGGSAEGQIPADGMSAVTATSKGDYVGTGGRGRIVQIWRVSDATEVARLVTGASTTALALSPDDQTLAVAPVNDFGRDAVTLWDMSSNRSVPSYRLPGAVESISVNGLAQAALASYGNDIRLWSFADNREVARLDLGSHAVFTDDDRLVAIGGSSQASLLDLRTKQRLLKDVGSAGGAAAVSRDGRYWAAANPESVFLWDTVDGREVAHTDASCDGPKRAMFSPDTKVLVLLCDDEFLRMRRIPSLDVVPRIQHDGLKAAAYAPDGRRVATASEDDSVRIWNVATWKEHVSFYHDGPVAAVAFSPDSRFVATGSDDRSARVWNAETGDELTRIPHETGVTAVAFSRDGKYLITGGADGMVRAWRWQDADQLEFGCQQPGRNLTPAEWKTYLGSEPYRKTCANLP